MAFRTMQACATSARSTASDGSLTGDALVPVVGYHPAVLQVRLLDVDDEEGHSVAVVVVETLQGVQLTPEGWSSVGAEDQRNRLPPCEVRQADQPTVGIEAR